jgi:hypothetical protein
MIAFFIASISFTIGFLVGALIGKDNGGPKDLHTSYGDT